MAAVPEGLSKSAIMARLQRTYPRCYLSDDDCARPQAAVLMLLCEHPELGLSMLFTERGSQMSSHAGEVSFPGGKRDAPDITSWHTALRECSEEIGLHPRDVERLTTVPPAISRFGLSVQPWVAWYKGADVERALVCQTEETEAIFWVPIAHFEQALGLSYDQFSRDGVRFEMPRWSYDRWQIWGLTAMIAATFLRPVCGPHTVRRTQNWWEFAETELPPNHIK